MARQSLNRTMLIYVAPALLCLIAVGQRYVAYAMNLTPWRGGGFGTYATTNSERTRFVSISLITAEGQQFDMTPRDQQGRLPNDRTLQKQLDKLTALPTETMAARVAERLAGIEWMAPPAQSATILSREAVGRLDPNRRRDFQPISLRSLGVTVWEYEFDAKRSEMRRTRLATAVHPLEDES